MIPPSKPQTWTHSDDCRHIYDDETDIRLDIDGNWASDAERKAFANRLCDLLNGAPVEVHPTSEFDAIRPDGTVQQSGEQTP